MNCKHEVVINTHNHKWCVECGALYSNTSEKWRTPHDLNGMRRFQEAVYTNAKDKGFWDGNTDWESPAAKIALMHSELSEALEAYRDGNEPDNHCPLHSSAEVEFADCIIRILDFCEHEGLDVLTAMKAKHIYNTKRRYKHGKVG